MILVIDVGNTNIVLGCMEGSKPLFSARISTDAKKTAEEYALIFKGILEMNHIAPESVEGGILSSVVPYLRTVLPNDKTQPEFGRALARAENAGVKVSCYRCHVESDRIEMTAAG